MAKIKITGDKLGEIEIEGLDDVFEAFGDKLDSIDSTLKKSKKAPKNPKDLEDSIEKLSKSLLGKKLPTFDSTLAKPLKQIGIESTGAFKGLGNFASGLGKFSSIFSKLFKAAGGWVGIIYEVTSALIDLNAVAMDTFYMFEKGEKRLSSYIDKLGEAAKKIPIFGAMITPVLGALGSLTAELERYRDVQADLSESGASFGGNLALMNVAAAKTQMSLEEYAAVIKQNSEALAKFGTVTTGALRFSAVSKELIPRLRNMGYSVKDINDQLPGVMEIFSAGALARGDSDEQIANSAEYLMKEFDAMAKITGQSRKSQIDAQKKTMNDVAVRMKMAGMTAEQQKALNAQMAQARAQFGEVGAEMIKLRMLGMPPLTESAALFTAQMGESANAMYRYTDSVLEGGKDFKANSEKMDESTVDAVMAAGRSAKDIQAILSAASAGMGGQAAALLKNYETVMMNQLATDGKIDREALLKKFAEARKESESRDKVIDTLNKFESQIAVLNEVFKTKLLGPFLNQLAPVLSTIADQFTSMMTNISKVADVLARDFAAEDWGDMIKPFISIMEESFKTIAPIFVKLTKIVFKIGAIFGPIIEGIIIVLKPFLYGIERALDNIDIVLTGVNKLVTWIRDIMVFVFGPVNKSLDEFQQLYRKFTTIFKMLFSGQRDGAISYAKQVFEETKVAAKEVWESYKERFTTLISIPKKLFDQAKDAVVSSWKFLKDSYASFEPIISEWYGKAKEVVISIFESVKKGFSFLYDLGEKYFKTYFEINKKIFSFLTDKAKEILDQIGPLFKKLCDNILNIRQKIIDTIQEGITCVSESIKKLLEDVKVKGWVDALNDVMKEVWDNFKNAIKNKIKEWTGGWFGDKEKPVQKPAPAAGAPAAGAPAPAAGRTTPPAVAPASGAPAPAAGRTTPPAVAPASGAPAPAVAPAPGAPAAGGGTKPSVVDRLSKTSRPSPPPVSAAKPLTGNLQFPEFMNVMQSAGFKDTKFIKGIFGKIVSESGGKLADEGGIGGSIYNIAKNPKNLESAKIGAAAARKYFNNENVKKATDETIHQAILSGPVALGNLAYYKMNGNSGPDDGWKYRGRGYIQITGKSNYAELGQKLFKMNMLPSADYLVNNPDSLLTDRDVSLKAAMAFLLRGSNINQIYKSQEEANEAAVNLIGQGTTYSETKKKKGKSQFVTGEKGQEQLRNTSKYVTENLSGFATGTIGMTGKAFENFGSGTTIQAHNLEGIFTPDQLKSIVNESQQRLSTDVVEKVTALITENPLQKQMVSLLSQAVDALNKSNRINNTIANSI